MSSQTAGWICIALSFVIVAAVSDWRPFIHALRLRSRARRMRKAVRP